MAAGLQHQQMDWTMHRTAMQLDWMFCLPNHQIGTADPTAILAISEDSFQLLPKNKTSSPQSHLGRAASPPLTAENELTRCVC